MASQQKVTIIDVVNNAERLLADANLLFDNQRFASAFMLAVLAFEEVGKALLWSWGESEKAPRSRSRVSFHSRKQSATAALLVGQAVDKVLRPKIRTHFAQHISNAPGTIKERLSSVPTFTNFDESARELVKTEESQLSFMVYNGVIDLTKRAATYVHHQSAERQIYPNKFKHRDPQRFIDETRRALRLMKDEFAMNVGHAIFRSVEVPNG